MSSTSGECSAAKQNNLKTDLYCIINKKEDYMLVQFVNNWIKKFLWQQNKTRPAASSNLAVLGIFSSNYLQIGPACSPITYTYQYQYQY